MIESDSQFNRSNYLEILSSIKKHVASESKLKREITDQFVSASLNFSKLETFFEKFPVEYINEIMTDSVEFIKTFKGDLKLELSDREINGKRYTQIKLLTPHNPLIVDSITSIINTLNDYFIEFSIQPILGSVRDKNGKLTNMKPPQEAGARELYLYFLIDSISDKQKEKLKADIENSVEESRLAVEDFDEMVKRTKYIARKLNDPIYLKKITEKETEDIKEFLMWLLDDNFIFLGARSYDIIYEGDEAYVQMDKDSCLGILRKTERSQFNQKKPISELPQVAQEAFKTGSVMVIDKTNSKSNVYDTRRMDYIAITEFDEKLRPIKRNVIIGLFTPKALKEQASNIPFLKSKLDRILFEENIVEESFEYEHLVDIFNTLPKDDLFISKIEELKILLEELLTCETAERIKVLLRRTSLIHGLYLMVVLPVKFYSQRNIETFTEHLKKILETQDVEYTVISQSSRIIRIHYYLIFPKDRKPEIDIKKIEEDLINIVSSWRDNVKNLIIERMGYKDADYYLNKYLNSFNDEYISKTPPEEAIFDINYIETLQKTGKQQVAIYTQKESIFFNIYSSTKAPLYEILPKLNNMGLHVLYEDFTNIKVDDKDVYIQRFSVDPSKFDSENRERVFKAIRDNFEAIWDKVVEDDGLNKLTVSIGMHWEYIDMLRAMGNYLMQVNFQIKKASLVSVLNKYSHISSMLMDYFEAKFSPKLAGKTDLDSLYSDIKYSLEAINDIHEYRIMHSILNIIDSMLRTNFYRKRKYHYISFKIESAKILTMPSPRPMFEIYVHSSFMEGCHLRGGKVARGGIRWSDRKDDFRLEILGLMKTQMVKNAVIVPVGSKGGFIVKVTGKDRQTMLQWGIKSYKTLMRGILDITDNFDENNNPVFPKDVVHYDDFDPYLVVAADKGTATFSDIANEISEKEYNFWLRDAFASGGKHGYDHKKIGITARGAWQCVERHFRELGKNVHKETFTVVGIGDMSGDVFGNGMLYTDTIILKAAFNHIEIFVDPNPDPKISYKERQRLFKEGLTWKYYDKNILSEGGFVADRNSKAIKLTPQAKEFLGTDADELSGEELIKLILQADVDLLWNGGIGTYVKSSTETNEEVGDRINDSVRINADQLRCKVIGEGGNLGLTQKARIEFALRGGKVNTDALDNSAGVDMSDHEVNLKILLNHLIKKGVIKDFDERNKILEELTDEVTQRVLTHNYMQSFAVSLDEYRSKDEPDLFYELTVFLRNKGLLHKEDYPFPSRKELSLRASKGIGYTRPELAVMLALNKMFIYDELLKSHVFSEDTIDQYATMYFPPTVRKRYEKYIPEHILRNEIAFTFIVNLIINNNGAMSLMKINMLTGQDYPTIMKTMIFTYDVLDILSMRESLFKHENKIPQSKIYRISLDMFDTINSLTVHQLYLFGGSISLDTKKENEVREWLKRYWDCCVENGIFAESYKEKVEQLSKVIDRKTAADIARLYFIDDFIPAFNIANLLKKELKDVVETIESVKKNFGIGKILDYINSIHIANEWDRLAQFSMTRNYILGSIILSTKTMKEFNGDVEALIDSKKEDYKAYTTELNTIMGTKSTNLHPVMLLYDKLQKIIK